MSSVIDIQKARLDLKVKKGYRNWASQFNETFGCETHLADISSKTIMFLAQGREKSSFYLYDLIMNLQDLGSGFELNELHTSEKMLIMDRYLFLLDRIRFEYMRRLGWLEDYPGQGLSLVEMIMQFERLAPGLQAKTPTLSRDHPEYERFIKLNAFEKEEFIRRLIPEAIKTMRDH
ncbi:MAG: hypothetical protein JW932_16000 [Deltaproteobacteria bacterium]|nr:hypothetical protein [Deltaproteobacteria bacterium]